MDKLIHSQNFELSFQILKGLGKSNIEALTYIIKLFCDNSEEWTKATSLPDLSHSNNYQISVLFVPAHSYYFSQCIVIGDWAVVSKPNTKRNSIYSFLCNSCHTLNIPLT